MTRLTGKWRVTAGEMATSVMRSQIDARSQATLVKMAGLMDDFDRNSHLDRLYGEGGLERAEEAVFLITQKTAEAFIQDHVQTINGTVYEKQALSRLDLQSLQQWFGDDMAAACGEHELDIEKLAAIVPTLPRQDAQLFDQMTHTLGIPVFTRTKAAADVGLSEDQLAQFATGYAGQQ